MLLLNRRHVAGYAAHALAVTVVIMLREPQPSRQIRGRHGPIENRGTRPTLSFLQHNSYMPRSGLKHNRW